MRCPFDLQTCSCYSQTLQMKATALAGSGLPLQVLCRSRDILSNAPTAGPELIQREAGTSPPGTKRRLHLARSSRFQTLMMHS